MRKRGKLILYILLSVFATTILFGVGLLYFFLELNYKILPNTYIASINVSGLRPDQAVVKLESKVTPPTIILVAQNFSLTLKSKKDLNLKYDFEKTTQKAFGLGHTGNILQRIQDIIQSSVAENNFQLDASFDTQQLNKILSSVSSQLNTLAVRPRLEIKNGNILADPGMIGKEVDTFQLEKQILNQIHSAQSSTINIPFKQTGVELSLQEIETLKLTGSSVVGKSLQLTWHEGTETIPDSTLLNFLIPKGVGDENIRNYIENLSKKINRPPRNARFVFKDGRVKEFQSSLNGLELDQQSLFKILKKGIYDLLQKNDTTLVIKLPVKETAPEISTQSSNNFGIKEIIGQGSSLFKGSSPARIHNIALAASRLNGLLIKPGEIFSFNKALGDISVYTGYQQSYIIKGGRTVLGDGGGVCQVSTTFFKAALNAGLPIVERHAHSYRVGYYEQDSKPGFDATIYSPTVDLKIKNDAPAYILIQAIVDTKKNKLTFQFYGTKDGRRVEISTPKIWDIQPPPSPEYIDDPTLPAGTLKQIDFPAYGAKVSFNYKVIRGGQTLQDRTFYSNYKPWQARYLRGVRTN